MIKSNMPKSRYLAYLGVVILSLPTLAFAVEPFNYQYQASYMGVPATGKMQLTAQGENRWEYSLEVTNQMGKLSQKTLFEEHDGKFRPLSGSDSAAVLIKKKAVNTAYNWQNKQATWTGDIKADQAGPVAIKAGDLDALLINLTLPKDVKAGRPLNYRMVEGGKVKPMSYRIEGKETITIAGQSLEATKVVRVTENTKRELMAWVVPNMPVPVRILQRENGQDTLELKVTSLN